MLETTIGQMGMRMQGDGRKGKKQFLSTRLIWLPLIAALLIQYAMVVSSCDASQGDVRNALHSNETAVTYEVTVSQNGQVLSSSVKESQAQSVSSPGASASEVFLQAAAENDAADGPLGFQESIVQSLKARIDGEVGKTQKAQDESKQKGGSQASDSNAGKKAQSLKGLKVNGNDIGEKRMIRLASNPPSYTDEVEYIDQNDFMQSGCELVALEVALHRMGFDEGEATEIAEDYVEYGGDPERYYTGSPYGIGGGFPPCIVDAANAWLEEYGDGEEAYDLTGSSFDSLCALVELGYPVLIWTTEDMAEPDVGENWYQPEHCVLMYGVEKTPEKKQETNKDEKSEEAKKASSSASDKSKSSQSASAISSKSSASSKSAASSSSSSASGTASSSSASASSKSSASSSSASATNSASSSSASGTSKSSSSSSSSSAVSSSASNASKSAASSSATSSKSEASTSSEVASTSASSSSAASSKSAASSSSSASSKSASSSAASSKSVASSSAASSKSAASSSSAAPSKSASSSATASKSSSSSSSASAAKYEKVLVSDSLAGLVKRDYEDFKDIYEQTGKRALFIQPKS